MCHYLCSFCLHFPWWSCHGMSVSTVHIIYTYFWLQTTLACSTWLSPQLSVFYNLKSVRRFYNKLPVCVDKWRHNHCCGHSGNLQLSQARVKMANYSYVTYENLCWMIQFPFYWLLQQEQFKENRFSNKLEVENSYWTDSENVFPETCENYFGYHDRLL